MLNYRLLLTLGIFRRSSYRLNTQVEMLQVLALPVPRRIRCRVTQLANGPVKSLAKPDVKLNRLKSVCIGINNLIPGGPSFIPHPPIAKAERHATL